MVAFYPQTGLLVLWLAFPVYMVALTGI